MDLLTRKKILSFKEWNKRDGSFTSFVSFMHFVIFHIVAHTVSYCNAKTLLHLSFIQKRQGLATLMTIELWYLHNLIVLIGWKFSNSQRIREGWWWLIRSFKDLSFLWMMMKKNDGVLSWSVNLLQGKGIMCVR